MINARRSEKVIYGDGNSKLVTLRMRRHANFIEYVPYALILLGLAESLNSAHWLLHAAGIVLILSRLLHFYGLSDSMNTMILSLMPEQAPKRPKTEF